MSKFYKNPSKIISLSDLNNIFGILSKQIAFEIKNITNIVNQNQYYSFVNIIYNLCREKILYYDFNIDPTKIFYLYIEICNENIELVAKINFIITKFYYLYSNSTWEIFINNKIINNGIVYNNLNSTQKSQLNYSIYQNSFYFVDNINITTITPNATGLLLKLQNCDCECNLISESGLKNSQTYIVNIYWHYSV